MLKINDFYLNCVNFSLSQFGINLEKNIDKPCIWVGYSGGVDSRVLLELANLVLKDRLKCKLIAVHINHGINKKAEFWEKHCYETCKNLSIELHVEKLQINDKAVKKFGVEAALREHRLIIWSKLLAKKDILLLAHHLNDQIETIFLRLLRGTGIKGLAGIKMANMLNNVKCIRPLLLNTREEIVNFANQQNLKYIEDDSNSDLKFSRNFLRHIILPKFYQYWPKFLYNINRAVTHLQQNDLYISSQVDQALLNCYAYNTNNKNIINKNHNILSITQLLNQNKFLQPQILRKFIMNQGLNAPSKLQIDKIYKEIIHARVDAQPQLKCDKYLVLRYRDKLYIYLAADLLSKKHDIKNKIGNLTIVSGKYLNTISNSDKAKKIFQKYAIPPWDRKTYSLVFLNNKLITIIGLWSKDL